MKTISCNDQRQALADVQQRSGMDGPKRTVKPGETNTRPRNTSQVVEGVPILRGVARESAPVILQTMARNARNPLGSL